MISVDYVQTMARYNQWQNEGMAATAATLDSAALKADRGAFFGSILGTMNHLLWADRIWMARLAGWPAPPGGIPQSVALTPTLAAWRAERQRVDGRLLLWADGLRPARLRGELEWFSAAQGQEKKAPVALCVMHMFNHQTHHRGQIHAMLTAAGATPQVTDLFAQAGRDC